jgi:hypothetical protein
MPLKNTAGGQASRRAGDHFGDCLLSADKVIRNQSTVNTHPSPFYSPHPAREGGKVSPEINLSNLFGDGRTCEGMSNYNQPVIRRLPEDASREGEIDLIIK